MREDSVKKERGCFFIIIIIISSFSGIAAFVVLGDYLVGPDKRHLLFFTLLALAGIYFLLKDLFKKNDQ